MICTPFEDRRVNCMLCVCVCSIDTKREFNVDEAEGGREREIL